MTLSEMLQSVPELSEKDAEVLLRAGSQMQYMADLSNTDIFLDCPIGDGKALVVAHAQPVSGTTAYERDVTGEIATAEKEPAVFNAIAEGVPICDIKAETQEGRPVRQNVCPVLSEDGRVIGVLIREKDISEELIREEKYEQLAKHFAQIDPQLRAEETSGRIELREVHHRVKNNLQLVASILNLQARTSSDPEVRDILKENVGRVQSIAIGIEGDDLELPPETASSVALVVAELVTNALRHGYPEKKSGKVTITVCQGALIHTIIVSDDGCGFDPAKMQEESLGLSIVRATVQDKLKGKLHIVSSAEGTKVSFDFKNE